MSILEQSQYGFDRNGRRTWQKRPLTSLQDQSYQYDALSQVSGAARGGLNLNGTAINGIPSLEESWNYDPTGNWRGYHTAANGAVTLEQHRVHDRGNRLTQIEDNPHNMLIDRVGRMRQAAPDASGDWDGKLEITWDAWSRITSVKNNGEVVGQYTYDGLTRRITREVGEETLHSYYDTQWRPVEERKDSETTAALSYLWGARHRDDLVRRDRAVAGTTLNETRYILMDYFNPAAITDEGGLVTERYAFSAFGLRTVLNPDYTVRSDSECAMEFGFQGQFVDVESGLMNYGYRYYSPYLGRWTCKDPIEEQGGTNLYWNVANKVLNHVDHLGLQVMRPAMPPPPLIRPPSVPASRPSWIEPSPNMAPFRSSGFSPYTFDIPSMPMFDPPAGPTTDPKPGTNPPVHVYPGDGPVMTRPGTPIIRHPYPRPIHPTPTPDIGPDFVGPPEHPIRGIDYDPTFPPPNRCDLYLGGSLAPGSFGNPSKCCYLCFYMCPPWGPFVRYRFRGCPKSYINTYIDGYFSPADCDQARGRSQ